MREKLIFALALMLAGCFSREPAKPTPREVIADPASGEAELSLAAERLGDSPEDRSVLVAMAADGRWAARKAAIARIGREGTPEAAARLEKAARDTDARVRMQALESLAETAGPDRAAVAERLASAGKWSQWESLALEFARCRLADGDGARKRPLDKLLSMARGHSDRLIRVDAAFKSMICGPDSEPVRKFLKETIEKGKEPRLIGRALDHLLAIGDDWPRANLSKLCLSDDPKFRETALAVAGVRAEDRPTLGRRLVERGAREAFCRELVPAKRR